ncbi:MAG: CoA transferase [Halieaceae bacterium]|nr:CoA transferase [Halieaceae bacterium]MCP5147745.1 CoA transferase [Pseudomonadales bacterium]MCP5167457.1 CoA transferase [Pseudomonadales bacterium]MCP5186969.1 CoA transferase [Pseudomonadales bacterium]
MPEHSKPLDGIKVVEFTHMVMGPAVGVILADLGADVVKVEPLQGDNTRRLKGSGAGYFAMYNRNKSSVCLDLKSDQGLATARELVLRSDIMIENFRPGAMDKLGLGYPQLSEVNPALIYCSLKGFLSGPYEHRTALDEVTQMMGGLAYMTGPPDRPLRAGSSVIDITGGMFGVIGILAALQERHNTGRGKQVTSSLFETTAFMVGQHIAQQGVSGEEPPPMSVRRSAWSVYDIFTCGDGDKVFVGVVSDSLWQRFCEEFELRDFADDPGMASNSKRVNQRDVILPRVEALFAGMDKQELMARLDRAGVPFAPINKPIDLVSDTHMLQGGGLVDINLESGKQIKLPGLPIEFDGEKPGLRRNLPAPGEGGRERLLAMGFSAGDLDRLIAQGVMIAY